MESKWVSVKERLPEDGIEVLGFIDGHRAPSWSNNYCLVVYLNSNGEFKEEEHNSEFPINITHWRPLPAPPEE